METTWQSWLKSDKTNVRDLLPKGVSSENGPLAFDVQPSAIRISDGYLLFTFVSCHESRRSCHVYAATAPLGPKFVLADKSELSLSQSTLELTIENDFYGPLDGRINNQFYVVDYVQKSKARPEYGAISRENFAIFTFLNGKLMLQASDLLSVCGAMDIDFCCRGYDRQNDLNSDGILDLEVIRFCSKARETLFDGTGIYVDTHNGYIHQANGTLRKTILPTLNHADAYRLFLVLSKTGSTDSSVQPLPAQPLPAQPLPAQFSTTTSSSMHKGVSYITAAVFIMVLIIGVVLYRIRWYRSK